jgi:2-keto-4-pentenoate hydratase
MRCASPGGIMVVCERADLMPITEEIIAGLAHSLIAAEQRCVPIDPITFLYPELTEADAYRVQMAVVATKGERGDRVIGRKVGATSQAIQQLLDIDEPIYGTLLESNQVANGETISLSHLIHPRVECEIAFLLGEDLVGPGIAVADVLAATQAVVASLEINDPRTREWKIGSREAIADNGVAARFVLGERWLPVDGLDLPNTTVVLKKNGEEVAAATGAAVLGDPARAVAWLANKLAENHQSLKAGEIVLPGSMTPIYPVGAGDSVEAAFEALESVSVRFA